MSDEFYDFRRGSKNLSRTNSRILLTKQLEKQLHTNMGNNSSEKIISDCLDENVTNFLTVLNDVGSKIACVLSNNISPVKVKKEADGKKSNILLNEMLQNDHAHSNIIEGINNLKSFFFEFGKNRVGTRHARRD